MKKDKVTELSLRPYTGRLFIAVSRRGYEKGSKTRFKDKLTPNLDDMRGRTCWGPGPDGLLTYLVWAESPEVMAHELSHVVLHVFERSGIDPIAAGGEPFCYMLGTLMEEALPLLKK